MKKSLGLFLKLLVFFSYLLFDHRGNDTADIRPKTNKNKGLT